MSTILIHPTCENPAAWRTPRPVVTTSPARRPASLPLRLTRPGQAVVVALFLAAALVLMVVFGGLATATREAGSPEPVRVVQVQEGDTLYGIAGEVAGPGEVRSMAHRIRELNSLSSSTLQAGQQLAIPRD